jgi:hypothetical protein
VEKFIRDAQAVVQQLDEEKARLQEMYEYGGDPQHSPIEALRHHRSMTQNVLAAPTTVVQQGKIFC